MPESRAEHLAWCKQRAQEYVTQGDLTNAWASMASDLRKHPDTEASVNLIALGILTATTPAEVSRFIDGFN